ncbi:TetR/AcrR family transcriptional regulator [Streptomyces inhibens]|uniref:TetR/AcrR family transcriptional regulator n=1 Tax=Streptomyces inhibens TaxID=2293571 RepID=UPI001EE69B33|nr:TetR/AcrR family transcriptional regulator [Streptomyces inhibens]UKY48564.1 TetR/AcrR family transcriptional regulator [Streptomyces inhibens]
MADKPPTRRAQQRKQTEADILRTARRLLAEAGPTALTLRAIARELNMTAPGIYRYFPDHYALVQAVIADLYLDLASTLEAARDERPEAATAQRLAAAARQLRRWALSHRREFSLLFGKPIADSGTAPDDPSHDASWRFGQVFLVLMTQLWREGTIPLPAGGLAEPAWLEQLEELREHLTEDVPLPVLHVFVQAWVRLYGVVSMEVFGHLDFALADPEPLFEQTLHEVLAMFGAHP